MEDSKTKIIKLLDDFAKDINQAELDHNDVLTALAMITANVLFSCSKYTDMNKCYDRLKASIDILLENKD